MKNHIENIKRIIFEHQQEEVFQTVFDHILDELEEIEKQVEQPGEWVPYCEPFENGDDLTDSLEDFIDAQHMTVHEQPSRVYFDDMSQEEHDNYFGYLDITHGIGEAKNAYPVTASGWLSAFRKHEQIKRESANLEPGPLDLDDLPL